MLLAQRPRELMLVGDEHRNQYFQVNIQVLTFFSFIFQCAQGTAFGLRLTLVDVVDDDEVLNGLFGAQLSVTKCLKFDLLV